MGQRHPHRRRTTATPGTPELGEDLGSLQFEDLSPRRVPPKPLPAALLDVATVRTAYQQASGVDQSLLDVLNSEQL